MNINLKVVENTKDYIIYEYNFNIEIVVGKNRVGNDMIIDLYEKSISIWCHADIFSSKHVIVRITKILDLAKDMSDIIACLKFVKSYIFNTGKKESVILCRLSDVKKTKTLGEVICENEYNMNDSTWTDILKTL